MDALLRADFWHTLTRLGEAQILLPAFGAFSAWTAARLKAVRSAVAALLAVGAAGSLTLATKVAFFGYGIGWPALDFTGLSGHAMFSAAVLPLLLARCVGPQGRPLAVATGVALAALIGVSRLAVNAHSMSEVLSGLAVGGGAAAVALHWQNREPASARVPRLLLAGLLAWMAITPAAAPPSPTHGWVVRLSLAVSGRDVPYSREQMHRDAAARAAAVDAP
ncbi:phosphatase PAP2 family protein [Aquabacterium sp. J223]|uniref:phosphatase PAP2 family protein n=1 Tax=Aquabacterium sp. J223 TaxID=2898431 RepID=UPI0021AE04E9|nr:phosphatase PAP2 family protein [Aquabacterium sp. J223]UUX96209.1 phosphatase PAP2 family protein [Aquabacterium sp. J223]